MFGDIAAIGNEMKRSVISIGNKSQELLKSTVAQSPHLP